MRIILPLGFFLAISSGALMAEPMPVNPAAKLPKVSVGKRVDSVTASMDGGVAVMAIVSPSGIGSAKLTRVGAAWPEPLVLRLSLRGLESLTLTNQGRCLKISVASHGDHRCSQSLAHKGKTAAVAADDPMHAAVSIVGVDDGKVDGLPGPGGGFKVVIPRALLVGESLELEWIDFFR